MENNKKILIVDDEAYIRRILQVKLNKHGYQVMLAKNGQEGFDIIRKHKPIIVIADINMPVMDGKTLCLITNRIKQERPFLTIIVTARIDPVDRDWTSEMQDTLFMEKPFSPARIVEAIEQYIGDKG